MTGAGWIVESTEKEAINTAKAMLEIGRIKAYDKVERYISGYKRKKKEPIYKYKIHCWE